jgi:hypothetical protein
MYSVLGTWGHAVAQWLRHCATNRKVAGSIPDSVIGIFHWHNPSGRTMTLGSTQPLTEMSTRNISWGWQPGHLHVPTVLKSGSLNLLELSGPVKACNGIALPLPLLWVHEWWTATIQIGIRFVPVFLGQSWCYGFWRASFPCPAKFGSASLVSRILQSNKNTTL